VKLQARPSRMKERLASKVPDEPRPLLKYNGLLVWMQ